VPGGARAGSREGHAPHCPRGGERRTNRRVSGPPGTGGSPGGRGTRAARPQPAPRRAPPPRVRPRRVRRPTQRGDPLGAPAPPREIAARPSRAIHFFDPGNEKMAAKVPDMVGTVDVLLGNLEDAVKAENKEKSRQGLVDIGKATDFGPTQFWTRINSPDSPWVADRPPTLVPEDGDKPQPHMVPQGRGAQSSPPCSMHRARSGWSDILVRAAWPWGGASRLARDQRVRLSSEAPPVDVPHGASEDCRNRGAALGCETHNHHKGPPILNEQQPNKRSPRDNSDWTE